MEPKKDDSWFIKDVYHGKGIVHFSSEEGKTVFFEANNAGFLNSYFELAPQFLTSFEPSYGCGLATLTMALNTFGLDPGRIWKDHYRWYKETMLDHCVPYNIIAHNGLVFQQFACMAQCNCLDLELIRCAKETESIDEFRTVCKEVAAGHCERILVCSYNRESLDQIGSGHYTPIGGYHPERDLVLVFDISRYKYPLHWLPLESLWKAMKALDPVTGNPRGYFVLRKQIENTKPYPLFKTVNSLEQKTQHRGWLNLVNTVLLPWHQWMSTLERNCINQDQLFGKVIRKLLENLLQTNCSGVGHLYGIHICLEYNDADPSLGNECLVCQLRKSLEKSNFYKQVEERVAKQYGNTLCACWTTLFPTHQNDTKPTGPKCCEINIQPSSCHLCDFTLIHFVVMILFSWPYDMRYKNGEHPSAVCSTMGLIMSTELSNLERVLKTEVRNTKKRFLSTR